MHDLHAEINRQLLPQRAARLLQLGACLLFATAHAQVVLPEPPLPSQSASDARAAAVQAPGDALPPLPVPPLPGAVGGSPIPLQGPSADAPPLPPAERTSAPQGAPLPTGFNSKVTSSTSASGQFKVYGKDLPTRGLFSSRCDDIAANVKRLLRDEQPWSLPVVVALKSPPDLKLTGPAVATSISQITNGGFHLQVTVQLRPDLRPADIDAEVTRILIAERILRHQKEITTKRSMVLPEWLLTGVTQAMNFRDRSKPSAVFTAIFRSGKIYGIDEILDAAPGQLDALSRTIYETSCCALVLALLDQIEGPASIMKFLSLLAVDSRDDRALLNVCFPNLALSASSLNKWWSLQMAALATPTVFETLGPTESRKALASALMIRYDTTADAVPKTRSVLADTDEPAADAPPGPAIDEKKRGLLGRFFGTGTPAAAAKETEPPPAEPKKISPAPADTSAAPDAEVVREEKKRGILGRMFGGSADAPPAIAKEETKADAPPPPVEPKKTATAEPKTAAEEAPPEAKKPGLLGRMFGGGSPPAEPSKEDTKPEPESKKSGKPKPEPQPKAETKTVPAAEPSAGEPKKRGLLGRMFGGGEKPKAEETPEKKTDKKPAPPEAEETGKAGEKKKSAAALTPEQAVEELRGQWIAAAESLRAGASELWAEFAAAPGRSVVRLPFGLGKKKSAEPDKPAGEEKPAEPAPTKPEPKVEPAPKAKAKQQPAKPKTVPVSIPIEDYANIMKRKDRIAILATNTNELSSLRTRAHVLFRPIIGEYIDVINDLKNGKTKDADEKLKILRARTASAYEQGKAVQAQLDVVEANETKNYSGSFEDFLNLPAQLEKELPVRDDPISKYLDALDKEFGK